MKNEINKVDNCIKEEITAKNSKIITINDVVFLNEECNITGINKKVEEVLLKEVKAKKVLHLFINLLFHSKILNSKQKMKPQKL